MKRKKLIIGVAVLIIALGFLGYQGFASSASYSYTVAEFLELRDSTQDQLIRLSGLVAPGSVEQKGRSLKFDVTDGELSVPVVYDGVVPDTFKAGGEVTVEGKVDGAGVFVAQAVMPKCPSKYVPIGS